MQNSAKLEFYELLRIQTLSTRAKKFAGQAVGDSPGQRTAKVAALSVGASCLEHTHQT
jgi:hypothetical protein